MHMKKIAVFTFIILFSVMAFGQEKKGMFSGTVKASATKLPLVEAVITLSSPVLEGKKFALTDSSGKYMIRNLPKGTYAITIEMEGFDTINYENIFLPEGMSQGVSVEMRRERKENTKVKRKKEMENSENK